VTTYRLRAQSVIHPGNFLVKHPNGGCYVFFAGIGELSVTAIDESMAEALGQSYEWKTIESGEELTLSELQARASGRFYPAGEGTDLTHPEG
jgi:hypothetical protein